MRKSKLIRLETNQKTKQTNRITLKKVSEGLEKIERMSIETPSQAWFEQFVVQQKKQAKEKWRKELILFSLVAAFILSLIIYSLYIVPVVFIILQALVILIVIAYSVVKNLKQVKQNEG